MTVNTGQVTEGLITLFQLDITSLGGPVLYFNSAEDAARKIVWGGQEYAPIPMDVSGFEYSTKGTIPQPTVTMSNLYGAGNLLLDSYKGLIGAAMTRIVTLTRFLDDGATPDPNAYISRDTYVVAQKTSHTAVAIAFRLASRMDQEGSKIPRRQILRDVCSHTYRVWNATAGAFDYSKATCPYTAAPSFNVNDQATTSPNDNCSRLITGCRARYGTLPLPARFFPNVGRVR